MTALPLAFFKGKTSDLVVGLVRLRYLTIISAYNFMENDENKVCL